MSGLPTLQVLISSLSKKLLPDEGVSSMRERHRSASSSPIGSRDHRIFPWLGFTVPMLEYWISGTFADGGLW